MKLTKAQIETLRAVERGEVTLHRETRMDYLTGAKERTVVWLLDNGFIGFPVRFMSLPSFSYILTDAGRAALESARQKEGK